MRLALLVVVAVASVSPAPAAMHPQQEACTYPATSDTNSGEHSEFSLVFHCDSAQPGTAFPPTGGYSVPKSASQAGCGRVVPPQLWVNLSKWEIVHFNPCFGDLACGSALCFSMGNTSWEAGSLGRAEFAELDPSAPIEPRVGSSRGFNLTFSSAMNTECGLRGSQVVLTIRCDVLDEQLLNPWTPFRILSYDLHPCSSALVLASTMGCPLTRSTPLHSTNVTFATRHRSAGPLVTIALIGAFCTCFYVLCFMGGMWAARRSAQRSSSRRHRYEQLVELESIIFAEHRASRRAEPRPLPPGVVVTEIPAAPLSAGAVSSSDLSNAS